ALHDAGGTTTFGSSGDVYCLTGCEDLDGDLVAFWFEVAELDEVALGLDARTLEVSERRLVYRLLALLVPAELDGRVAVACRGFTLHHRAGPSEEDGYRNQPVVPPDLGHAYLG